MAGLMNLRNMALLTVSRPPSGNCPTTTCTGTICEGSSDEIDNAYNTTTNVMSNRLHMRGLVNKYYV